MPQLPVAVLSLIASYLEDIPLTLHPELSWNEALLANPHATHLIHDYLCCHLIGVEEMQYLVRNPNPAFLSYVDFHSYPELIQSLCTHPSEEAMQLLETLPQDEWQWDALSANPYAIRLLRANPENIYLENLAQNPNGYPLIKKILEVRRELRMITPLMVWVNLITGIHKQQARRDFPEIATRVQDDNHELRSLVQRSDPKSEVLLLQWLSQHDPDVYQIEILCEAPWTSVLQRVLQRVLHQLEDPCPSILSENPAAIDMLLEHRRLIWWCALANNPSPRVIEVVLKYKYSFLAAENTNKKLYKRRELLVVDEKRYREILEQKVKILSQY